MIKSNKEIQIRLNAEKLKEIQIEQALNDTELAELIGVSPSTLWRVRLPVEDNRYNAPGEDFIAGVLNAFPNYTFDHFFFLDRVLRRRQMSSKYDAEAS